MPTALLPATTSSSALPAVPSEHLAALARHAEQARGALAANTERALRADTALYTAWCTEAGLVALPAAADTLAAFVDAQGELGKRPATVRRYLASIAHLHRAAGLESPTAAEAVRLAVKRLGRALGSRQDQAQGITQREAQAMLLGAEASVIGRRDAALLLVMRDALLRRSEAVALEVSDVQLAEDGTGTVLIRRSKTDQEGAGSIRLLGPDATLAVREWIAAAGIAEGALFRSVGRNGRARGRLPAGDVPRILKRLAARAGINPERISGHSCRVGMAQDLLAHGCDLAELMQAGGWKSPTMPARYTERLAVRRGAVARLYGIR